MAGPVLAGGFCIVSERTSQKAPARASTATPRPASSWGLLSAPAGNTITLRATAVKAVSSTSSICTTCRRR